VEKAATTPEHLLSSFDDEVNGVMRTLDALIRECMPARSRTVWEGIFWGGTEQRIIGYGTIVQPRPRGADVEWFLVGLARQSASYSLYVNATEDDAYLLKAYGGKLGNVKLGSASIGFTGLADVDIEGLRELLTRAHEVTPPDAQG